MTAPPASTDAISYDAAELDVLRALEGRHFWFRVRRAIILDALRRRSPDMRDYLELGAGTGSVARAVAAAFPHALVVATDPLAAGLDRLDVRELAADSGFDVVAAFDVLEHIDADEAALRRMFRACRPGGMVLLTVPQHRWLWSAADVRAQHFRRYTNRDLRAKLNGASFAAVETTSFNTATLLPFVLRLLAIRVGGRDPGAALLPRPLDALLAAGMQVDRWAIRAGLRLPIGGSLLAAARRPP